MSKKVSIDRIICFGYNYTCILEKSNKCPLKYEIINHAMEVKV